MEWSLSNFYMCVRCGVCGVCLAGVWCGVVMVWHGSVIWKCQAVCVCGRQRCGRQAAVHQ